MSIDFIRPEVDELRPRISVIGVGGAGGNAIANMMRADVQGEGVAAHEAVRRAGLRTDEGVTGLGEKAYHPGFAEIMVSVHPRAPPTGDGVRLDSAMHDGAMVRRVYDAFGNVTSSEYGDGYRVTVRIITHSVERVVLVHGDTASTLLGAMAARSLRLPVAHVESGLSSGRLLDPFPHRLVLLGALLPQ